MGNSAVKTLRKKNVYLQMPELVRNHGYPIETHKVVTEDGYRLTLYRIPGGRDHKKNKNTDGGPPRAVLMQHGLLCDSTVFTVGDGRALAYLLADRGYDVWLGNNRGTRPSRDHVTLSPDAPDGKFWEFSWHEMGTFDLPAVTDYILNISRRPQITYIGYSQGCTQFFVMGSERPEYGQKIEAMFGLAPALYMTNARSVALKEPWRTILNTLNDQHELYKEGSVEDLVMRRTAHSKLACKACVNLMGLISGGNKKQVDYSIVPAFLTVFPTCAATRQLLHYQQLFLSGGFRRFDHGPEKNLQVYGQAQPPEYNISKVSCPVTFFYSLNDYLADPADVKKAYKQLGSPAGLVAVPQAEFTHLDFVWARDVKQLLYDELLDRVDEAVK